MIYSVARAKVVNSLKKKADTVHRILNIRAAKYVLTADQRQQIDLASSILRDLAAEIEANPFNQTEIQKTPTGAYRGYKRYKS